MAIIMGVLMLPLIGFIALGVEASYWALTARQLQGAADSAAISAALNGSDNYDAEAKAVASFNGFDDVTASVSVSNTALCPDGGGVNCYSVTIARDVSLLFAQVIGFRGDGHGQMHLEATAVASPSAAVLCALADSITATSGDLNSCNTMANSTAQCDGSTGIGTSFAHGANSGCGARRTSTPTLPDPYTGLASNIPSHLCGSGVSPPLSGSILLGSGVNFLCGDQRLGGNVTITTPLGQSSVLIIVDGHLDLAGHTLTTGFASAATLVFSGSSSAVTHAPIGVGGLDITPPTTGPWAGVALAQDPNTMTGIDFTIGDGWRTTGLVYAPHATVTWTAPLDKSTNGKACAVVVAGNLQINGGGIAKSNLGQCEVAGLTQPRLPGASARLVQ